MRTRIPSLAVAVAAAALAAGCGSSSTSCPTESPIVDKVGNCSAVAATTVSFPIRLCPTCNQTLTGCDVDLSAVGSGYIHLNPLVEVCQSASSCGGAACNLNPATCTFTAPTAPVSTAYTVTVYDPQSGGSKTGSLTIVAGAPSCAL